MAKEKKPTELKSVLEREYIVPLRHGWLKVPEYKRGAKAIKTLKEFIMRHMKTYDSDLRTIKIDNLLNNEIRFRGMKKPPAKIKVKATKFENNIVRVELVDLPEHVRFEKARNERKSSEVKKKVEEIEKTKPVEETEKESEEEGENKKGEDKTEEVKDVKEEVKESKQAHKKEKTASSEKQVKVPRKTLSR